MIKFVDMFSGIGGFREGLSRAGGFECVGHCEIDKYANRSYNALFDTKGEWFVEDARKADPETMPEFRLLCGGFPCQTFSIAGSRKGFGDPRGTLFFELARLAEARKPPYLLFENVVGLINHDHCRTFATILNTLDRLGYGVEWQCLNSKDFGVPQSRNRVYIVGYLDERCRGKVFPFTEATGGSLIQTHGGHQGERVYSPEGLSCTLAANPGGFGGKTGLYEVGVPIKCATKTGYQLAQVGDSIDLSYATVNSRRGRVGKEIAHYGEYSDYTRKGGVICSDILLPSHAPKEYADRQTLWNAVEKAERGKTAQLAYSFDIALQNEFSLEENIALARQFLLEQFVSRGMVVDFAVHQPDREDGGIPNPHFHVLCPIRPIEQNGKWGCKQHRVYELDEDGNRIRDADGNFVFNAVPTTDWGSPETLEYWRQTWAELCNAKFAEKGLDVSMENIKRHDGICRRSSRSKRTLTL